MAEAASAADAPKVSRLDRRKARTRQALIDAAVRLIAEGRGDRASIAEITDPAELFAVGTRVSGRLGWTHPDIAGFLTGMGMDALDIPGGLAPRALRDIQAGQAAGRFTVPDPEIALSEVAGGCSGCCGCASGTQNASRRPPSTSSPRPNCACSASPADEAARLHPPPAGHRGLVTAETIPPVHVCANRDEPARPTAVTLRLAAR